MSDVTRYFFLGLGPGGIYALLAIGIVLVYRGSGVVNFAAGGFALVGSAIYLELNDSAVGQFGAMAIAVAVTAVLGIVLQMLILRPIRAASPLARVVATLGVTVALESAAKWHYGTESRFVVSFLPTTATNVAGVIVGADRLYILAIVTLLCAGLWALGRFTIIGIATTALAESPRATACLGWSPTRLAVLNWALGGALSGLAGVLLVPIVGFAPTSFTLLIVPALAVAVVAGFRSFPLALAGGIVVGVLESEGTMASTNYPHGIFGIIPTFGLASSVPFVLIIVLLAVRGRAIPLRGEIADRLPRLGTGMPRRRTLAVVVVVVTVTIWSFAPGWAAAVSISATIALIGLSVVVVTGYAGQLSLAQFALAGVGALVASRLADAAGVPFPVAAVLGVITTVGVGLIVALPAVRVRGVNLAVVTMAFAVVISSAVLSNTDWNGGAIRGTRVPDPSLFGLDVQSVTHPERWALLCVCTLAFAAAVVSNLRTGRSGRRLIAIRDNERAAASLGVSVFATKLYAFAVGAGLAGLGGVLLAFRNTSVDFSQFSPFRSIEILLLTLLGGIGFVGGGIVAGIGSVGGVTDYVFNLFWTTNAGFRAVLSLLFLVAIVIHPDGFTDHITRHVVPRIDAGFARIRRGRRQVSRPASEVPPASATAAVSRVSPHSLTVQRLGVRFGGVVALDSVNLTVAPGEVVGLIGPNGAGKTTVVDAIAGFLPSYDGSVLLDGVAIDSLTPSSRAKRGLTRSFQSLELFEDLSVGDNLRVAADDGNFSQFFKDLLWFRREPFSDVTEAVIAEFGLRDCLDLSPSELSYAQRRAIAIARAVATKPSVLLLDEPAAGLDSTARRELEELVVRLAHDWGMAVLLIEHDVAMVMRVCDRVMALNFGSEVVTGTPEEVRRNAAFIDAYLGAATMVESNDDGQSDGRDATVPSGR